MPHNRFKEVRLGTLVTYLRAARTRPNLTIRALSSVDRIQIEKGKATGITWLEAGKAAEALADMIIVSAGVYNTPAILQRSSIGPEPLLRRNGIPVKVDSPRWAAI